MLSKVLPSFTSLMFLLLSACGSLGDSVVSTSPKMSSKVSSFQGATVGGYSCEQQASWGKCGEPWMHPTCDDACKWTPNTIGGHTCEQQASWGKCGEAWMHPTCDYACPNVQGGGYYYPSGPYTNGGLIYPDLGAHNGRGGYYPYPGPYTNGGLIYPDLGAHNGGGGYYPSFPGGYTTGGLIYPDLGAHNGGGYYGY